MSRGQSVQCFLPSKMSRQCLPCPPTPSCPSPQPIMAAIEKLSKTHAEHISQYGTGNEQRLTGKHETCDVNTFRCGGEQGYWCVAHADCRITAQCFAENCSTVQHSLQQMTVPYRQRQPAGLAMCTANTYCRCRLDGNGRELCSALHVQ
jgi:hypothetical protein